MGKHAHLPTMMSLLRKHVAQHFHAGGPRRSPTVPAKLLDAGFTTGERFSEHFRAAGGALDQSGTGCAPYSARGSAAAESADAGQ
jgi:hypothetical protein